MCAVAGTRKTAPGCPCRSDLIVWLWRAGFLILLVVALFMARVRQPAGIFSAKDFLLFNEIAIFDLAARKNRFLVPRRRLESSLMDCLHISPQWQCCRYFETEILQGYGSSLSWGFPADGRLPCRGAEDTFHRACAGQKHRWDDRSI